jgi:hypothetical protein
MSSNLFPRDRTQRLIPFLGAGVSLSGRVGPDSAATVTYPDQQTVNSLADRLGLDGAARILFTTATLVAVLVQSEQHRLPRMDAESLRARLEKERFPPSAAEIAWLCSKYANYTTLQEVAGKLQELSPAQMPSEDAIADALEILSRITRVASPPDALSSIAAYYERSLGRDDLWSKLSDVISTKNEPTETHKLLAEAAAHSVTENAVKDYLLITTNYDMLMETALEQVQVPFVTLITRVDNADTQNPIAITVSRFSPHVQNREELQRIHPPVPSSGFSLRTEQRMAVLYKIHGDLDPELRSAGAGNIIQDAVVISDTDYVQFLSQKDPIPSHVTTLMTNTPFMFLGYSLNDWNVRSIFETIRRKRADPERNPDFCINKDFRAFEELFFLKHDVRIYREELNRFAAQVRRARGGPPPAAG